MNLTESQSVETAPDEGFVEMIRDILSHLYDYPYLQTHPLADRFGPGKLLTPQERARILRTTILKTIEEMHPGSVPFRSVHARAYNVLNLHYVEGLTIQEVARELAISERQCYRDLRKAEESLAAVLWAIRVVSETGSAEGLGVISRGNLVRREAARLSPEVSEINVCALLEGALEAVKALAVQRGVQYEMRIAADAIVIRVDRLLVRQALVSALSYAVQNASPQTVVRLDAFPVANAIRVQIAFTAQKERKGASESLVAAQQLARRAGGECVLETKPFGELTLNLTFRQSSHCCVLVIDDNAGLIELLQRYLTGEPYEVMGASDGREGLFLASERRPDVIVLDIMMPQQDGWEVLQRLKTQEKTKDIPVIVCSVLNDPELAFSLGACEFLAKPVTRDRLLTALKRCQ